MTARIKVYTILRFTTKRGMIPFAGYVIESGINGNLDEMIETLNILRGKRKNDRRSNIFYKKRYRNCHFKIVDFTYPENPIFLDY